METPEESMADRLARHPFLAGMDPRHLGLLADCATTVAFKKGEVICREGDLADRFYLLDTGKVRLESSSGLHDPHLGWSWMFPPHRWTYTSRAVEPVTGISFYGTILRQYCENDHSFGYEFLKRLSFVMHQRLQELRNRALPIHHRTGTLQAGAAGAA